MRDEIHAVAIDADDLVAVEQHDQTHGIEPRVGTVRMTPEHIEIGPSASGCLVCPAAEEDARCIDTSSP